MIACLVGNSPRLKELADQFSSVVEQISPGEVIFTLDGLGSLFGSTAQIAAEIGRHGSRMDINANLAIAVDKATARLAARHYRGVTIVPPGHEAAMLAEIPVTALPGSSDLLDTFLRWGVRTLGELAALPESGVTERLGNSGSRLQMLARGRGGDVVVVQREASQYVLTHELDDAIEHLEPLLFVISSQLHELTGRMRRDGHAASSVTLRLVLDRAAEFVRKIEFPVATRDPLAVLKQLQLSLDADPPGAGICAVRTEFSPADPRVVQNGLFRPVAPEPDKLQTLMARLVNLAGRDKVGSPEILDTHRPDAFRMVPCAFESSDPAVSASRVPHVAFRHFRPPVGIRVIVQDNAPIRILSEPVTGRIVQSAGPWRTSGGLWAASSWHRDEWDIVLETRALYRIYSTPEKQWFLGGSYD